MKNTLLIGLILLGLALASDPARAQYAPSSFNYAIVSLTVTSGTLPFSSSGSESATLTQGNYFTYNVSPQIAQGFGTYTYTQTGPNTGALVLTTTSSNPAFVQIGTITFTSANSGIITFIGSYAGYTGSSLSTFTVTYLQPQTTQTAGTGIALLEAYELTGESGSTHRLVNIATRGFASTGANILDGGFVISGTANETVLIRAGGPFLALPPFNLSGTLSKPVVTLYDSQGNVVASNTGWSNALIFGNSPLISKVGVLIRPATAADFSSCGAYPYVAGSADSAMTATLPPGAYTVVITGL